MPIGSAHWVADDMLRSLRNVAADDSGSRGYAFDIVNQFFHAGRPLGWMRSFRLAVDGEAVAPETVTLVVNGQRLPATLIPELDEVWWQPRDVASLVVRTGDALGAGVHHVAWSFDLPLVNFTPVVDREGLLPTHEATLEGDLELVDTRAVDF